MANQEQVEKLKTGVTTWNEFRRAHPELTPDLKGAELDYLDLRHALLSGADLSDANLSATDLSGSELMYTNLCGAVLADGTKHRSQPANLTGADLTRAALADADLTEVNLSHAVLIGAELRGAKLVRANLCGADLTGSSLNAALLNANLSYANLTGADLSGADLTDARLNGANLTGANLSHAKLAGVHFEDAVFGATLLSDLDLRESNGLELARHTSPSSIGVDTLYRSDGAVPDVFLRSAGVPEEVLLNLLPLIRLRAREAAAANE